MLIKSFSLVSILQIFVHHKTELNIIMKYFEASPSLTTWECIKMAAPVVIFSIVLPFVDIITDLRTIILLYLSGNPIFATLFLGHYFLNKQKIQKNTYDITGPFLANYLFSFIHWYRFEKSNISLIWALLNLYPIYGWYMYQNNT